MTYLPSSASIAADFGPGKTFGSTKDYTRFRFKLTYNKTGMPSLALLCTVGLVMYFSLLPARREGETYAPKAFELGIVTVLFSGAFACLPIFIAGGGGELSWLSVVVFIVAFYLASIAARKILHVRVLKYENTVLILAGIFAVLGMLVFPFFGQA